MFRVPCTNSRVSCTNSGRHRTLGIELLFGVSQALLALAWCLFRGSGEGLWSDQSKQVSNPHKSNIHSFKPKCQSKDKLAAPLPNNQRLKARE